MKITDDNIEDIKQLISVELEPDEYIKLLDLYEDKCPKEMKDELRIGWAINYLLKKHIEENNTKK